MIGTVWMVDGVDCCEVTVDLATKMCCGDSDVGRLVVEYVREVASREGGNLVVDMATLLRVASDIAGVTSLIPESRMRSARSTAMWMVDAQSTECGREWWTASQRMIMDRLGSTVPWKINGNIMSLREKEEENELFGV